MANNNSVVFDLDNNNSATDLRSGQEDGTVTQFRKLTAEEKEARKRNQPSKLKLTDSDIATILKLRQEGVTFMKIDEIVLQKVGSHGNYSFRICQKYTLS